MHPAYQRLVRNEQPRGLVRELGFGIALLVAILLGFLLLPALPGEAPNASVGSPPPHVAVRDTASSECGDADHPCSASASPLR